MSKGVEKKAFEQVGRFYHFEMCTSLFTSQDIEKHKEKKGIEENDGLKKCIDCIKKQKPVYFCMII